MKELKGGYILALIYYNKFPYAGGMAGLLHLLQVICVSICLASVAEINRT